MGADFNGEMVDAEFAKQQAGAQPSRREFLRAFPHRSLQMPRLLGVERGGVPGAAQFCGQCTSREQLIEAARQTRRIGFDAGLGITQGKHFDRMPADVVEASLAAARMPL